MKKLFEKYREIIVYIFVGLLTTIVSYGVKFAILYPVSYAMSIDLSVSSDPRVSILRGIAQTVGWAAAVVFAFIPNKKWVFRNEENDKKRVFAQFVKFVASRISTYFAELAMNVLLPMLLLACGYKTFRFIIDIDADLMSMPICIVVITVLNYIISKLLVFRKKKDE